MPVDMSQIAVDLQGCEAKNIFLDPIFTDGDLMNLFEIMPNIKSGSQKMLFAGTLDNILRQRKGCGFDPVAGLKMNQRCISVTRVKGETAECFEEFSQTILQELLRSGVEMGDLTGTQIAAIILERLQTAAVRQINMLAFFGDKASGNAAQNIVDGLWTVYLPQLVTQNLTPRVNSTSGTALGAGDAIALFDAVFDGATNELDAFDEGEKVIMTTRQVWEQLKKDYRDNVQGSCCFLEQVENGRERLFYNGIEVMKMARWEGLASQFMGTVLPGVTSNFNLVLYTHRRNLVLGTNMVSDINRIQTWFDMDSEEYRTRQAFQLGFNYVHPSLFSVAY
jgi:hypothetical protein